MNPFEINLACIYPLVVYNMRMHLEINQLSYDFGRLDVRSKRADGKYVEEK